MTVPEEPRYRLRAVERDGAWTAYAERLDTGDRWGIEQSGPTEARALERLRQWLDWQHEHAEAIEALQHAERMYHRAIAGGAFAAPGEGAIAVEMQRESLDAVEAARVRLDDVRARRPDAER